MDPIKESFQKIKRDINSITNEINNLKEEFNQTRTELIKICEIMLNLDKRLKEYNPQSSKHPQKTTPTHNSIIQATQTHTPTHNLPFNALKDQNKPFSSGNEGVPTDRQTDRQTDTRAQNPPVNPSLNSANLTKNTLKTPKSIPKSTEKDQNTLYLRNLDENPINNAARILDSLDSIKKEIRLKFKRLTQQEMLVFSTLYQMEETLGNVDYKVLAVKLNLTESSVRDYIGRLLKKGIPVDKKRINNKTILLSVSSNLKRIASLSTIIQLRDL